MPNSKPSRRAYTHEKIEAQKCTKRIGSIMLLVSLFIFTVFSDVQGKRGVTVTIVENIGQSGNQQIDLRRNVSWRYVEKLFFNNSVSSESFVDFPVLLHLTAKNFNFSLANSHDYTLRFIDSDNMTELSYEIDYWNQTAEDAYIWIKVPKIDAGSTSDHIYMYFDNTTSNYHQNIEEVWDSNFIMVQHLNEVYNKTFYDSTINNNEGILVNSNSHSYLIRGKIGGALSFNGNNYINVSHNNSLYNSVTFEALINPNKYQYSEIGGHIIVTKHVSWQQGLYIVYSKNPNLFYAIFYDGITNSIAEWNIPEYNAWYYVVAVFEDNTSKLYVNGQLMAQGNTITAYKGNNNEPIRIGGGILNRYANAIIDEVRISNISRSANWINAQYLSLTNQFIQVGFDSSTPKPSESSKDFASNLIEQFYTYEFLYGSILGLVTLVTIVGVINIFKSAIKSLINRLLGIIKLFINRVREEIIVPLSKRKH
jgi:hypothetical protein